MIPESSMKISSLVSLFFIVKYFNYRNEGKVKNHNQRNKKKNQNIENKSATCSQYCSTNRITTHSFHYHRDNEMSEL